MGVLFLFLYLIGLTRLCLLFSGGAFLFALLSFISNARFRQNRENKKIYVKIGKLDKGIL